MTLTLSLLKVRDGRPVRITTHVGGGKSSEYSKHVEHVFESGRSFLEQLVTDPEYQGLFMLQLKDVAAAFRVKPPLLGSSAEEVQPAAAPLPTSQDAKPTNGALSTSGENAADRNPFLRVKPVKEGTSGKPMPLSDDFELPHAETYFS